MRQRDFCDHVMPGFYANEEVKQRAERPFTTRKAEQNDETVSKSNNLDVSLKSHEFQGSPVSV